MRNVTFATLNIVALAIAASAATAKPPFGTRQEAVAMVERVKAKFRRDGPAITFKAINAKTKEFHDRDLYAYVIDFNGVNFAHGARAELVGTNNVDFKDQTGKFFIREEIDVCKSVGSGWVNYRWLNPKANTVEDKAAYVERMGDYCVGTGVYRNEQPNGNTIAIMTGGLSSDDTDLQLASDLALVLNDSDSLRILPVVGIGGSQTIRDVRNLKGIDIGLTQVSILNNFRRSNQESGLFDDKIVYVAKLYNAEVHLLARADITSIEQLQGQKVNIDQVGSGTNYSMRDIFKNLNLKVEEVSVPQAEAIERMKHGEIAATVLIAGKPTRAMSTLNLADGLHLLSVPFRRAFFEDYLPTTFTHDDYPNMIPQGQSIATIADGMVLIAYNWPKNTDRYRRVQAFVGAFFPRVAEFQKPPHHPKWHEVNLRTVLPGWTRLEPAQAWLNSHPESDAGQGAVALGPTSAGTSAADTDPKLFEEFLRWKRAHQSK